jgi:hypothetical protein
MENKTKYFLFRTHWQNTEHNRSPDKKSFENGAELKYVGLILTNQPRTSYLPKNVSVPWNWLFG